MSPCVCVCVCVRARARACACACAGSATASNSGVSHDLILPQTGAEFKPKPPPGRRWPRSHRQFYEVVGPEAGERCRAVEALAGGGALQGGGSGFLCAGMKKPVFWKGGFAEADGSRRRIQNPMTRPHLPHPAPSATVVTRKSEGTTRYPYATTPAPSSFRFLPQLLHYPPQHHSTAHNTECAKVGFERTGGQPTENRGSPAKKFPPRQTHEGHDNANHLHPLGRRDRPHL